MNTKQTLDNKVAQYHQHDFIAQDPIQFPHRYSLLQDIEISALLASTIAWGRRDMILRSCEKMFAPMNPSPYSYIMNEEYESIDPNKNIHRTFFGRDFIYICRGLNHIYSQTNTLESLFIGSDTWGGINNLRNALADANNNTFSRHISNPQKSACKRLHMMLRWLCRQNSPVDLGIWSQIPASSLQIPLDTHVARVSLELKLTARKSNDRRTVEEITSALSVFCPNDPIIYDFALFSIGINSPKSSI